MAAELVTEPGRRRRVLLVGAGHAHVEVLRRYAARPDPSVQLMLLTPSPFCQYSGMIPGVIAGQFAVRESRVDVGALVCAADGALVVGSAIGLDPASRRVICGALPPIDYDLLSLDIGAAPALPPGDQTSCDCIVTKPADTFLRQIELLVDRHAARVGRSRVAIVGGGAAAIELALALNERLMITSHGPDSGRASARIVLICKSETLAPDLSAATRRRLEAIVATRGIEVMTGREVTSVSAGILSMDGYEDIAADEVILAIEVSAPAWLGTVGLPLNKGGFIRVNEYLQVEDRRDIFAAGDVASFIARELPKSGVYAVRQGPILHENIKRTLSGESLIKFRPQRRALYLVSTGRQYAIGSYGQISFEGRWVWLLKRWLDTRWIASGNRVSETILQT
jgi:selenide,water dikinase